MLLTRNRGFLDQPVLAGHSTPRPPQVADIRLWTDDYSNLFQILK